MEYTEDQLTEWFDIEKQKPLGCGVYQVNTSIGYWNGFAYSYWNGEEWSYTCNTPDESYSYKHIMTSDDITQWRGLNFNQNAPKPKKGNKRKTMYVVHAWLQHGEVRRVVGSFSSLWVAMKKKARYEQSWIEKIRFRTPEA